MPRRDLHLVVMAGGSGTRFWPKSTSRKPKQLLSFDAGERSLLALTLARFNGLVPADQRIIVTTEALHQPIAAEAPGVTVLAEPQGRNTAPCIYWAARVVAERDPDGVMLVMSSDHYVPDVEAFRMTVAAAAEWARGHDDLVALGVRPSRPETGYGYLKVGDGLGGDCHRVEAFVEKPNRARAEEFVAAGTYLWNGGMFVWRAATILAAFDRAMPEMGIAWEAAGDHAETAYPHLPATSIDYGVMEKAPNVVTFALDCGWEDVGTWASLEALAGHLGAGHPGGALFGGDLVAIQSARNIVDAPGKLVALLGVEDLIVVQHGDAILVARKDRAQDVRLVVDEVKRHRPEMA